MLKNRYFVSKYLLFYFIPIIFFSCVSIPSNQNNLNGFIEVDRFYIEYDEDLYINGNMFFTSDEDYKLVYDVFFDHLKNAHLIKVSSNVHLNENKDHQFAIHRKNSGTEYVKFYIYKLEIVYKNFTIYYDFISNSTVGAANYGNDHGFFNLYKEDLDEFIIDVKAEMKLIINSLMKSKDLSVLGQVATINYCLSENFRRYFP